MILRALAFVALLSQAQPPDPMAEASAHLDAGRYVQAVEILKGLAEKEPKDLTVQFNYALALSLAGRDDEAIAGYRRVLAIKDDLYEGRLNLGQLLVKTGKSEEAVPLLQASAQTKPGEFKPHYLLGRALAAGGKWPDAATELARAAEIDPKNNDVRLELAEVYEKSRQPDKAAELYRLFPDDAAARERLGLLLLASGDHAGAIENLEAARAKSPTPGLLYALTTAYLRNHQLDKATPMAEALVAAEPSNLEARMLLGRLLRDQKKYDEAAKQFAVAVKAKPDSGEAWNEFTSMLILLKQYEPALAALERAKTLNGETPAYHYFRATMLDATKQVKPALESYQQFLAVAGGKYPDEEFKARQRVRVLEKAVKR